MNPRSASRYVQFGCAYDAPEDWINFDSSPTLRLERIPLFGRAIRKNGRRFPDNVRYGDIVKGLPIARGSCAGIYACHVLEHMTLSEARLALRNTLSLLAPGGVFRIVVPDLKAAARQYVLSTEREAAHEFMRSTMLGLEAPAAGLVGRMARALGRSNHLWMWDRSSMAHELQQAGFLQIRDCLFNDSPDPMFELVERRDRFDDAIAFECRK